MAIFHTISLLVVSIPSIYALSCIPCDRTRPCVKPINCKGGLVKGVCGCCDVCAKTQGERCGGPWRIHGHCAKGLKCLSRTRTKNESGFLPKPFQAGICGSDVCTTKICGFKEKCKISKSLRPMCICPRRCSSKRHQPVCGWLNGKEYRNKCKLNREECFTKKEIGLIPGPCKKCTYQGQKYQFGDTRPDAKPCEICICRHGLWKCEIKLNCSTNSIPKSSKGRNCLMSTNAIYVACPLNYSCRIPHSDDNRKVRIGICKKVVYKPKKVPMLLEIVHNLNSASVSQQGDGTKRITPSMSPTSEKLENTEAVTINSVNEGNHYVMKTVKPTTRELNKKKLKGGLIRHVCMADADAGTCNPASLNRWYYNASSKSCEQFQYSGCGGNFNNFLSKEKCQDVCHSELLRRPWNPILTTQSSVLYRVSELTDKSSRDMLLEMCHDIKTGMSYRNGEKWNIDECISCTCASGRDLCIAASCHATCSKPIHVKGKCCPICESDLHDTETKCKDPVTGVSYHSGESWNRNDCVHCICFEGETSCMTSVCTKPTCEQPIKKDGVCCPVCSEDEHEQVPKSTKEIEPRCVDSDSGQSYTPGEAWKVNDCISCFCDQSGLSTCHKLSCPKSKCTNPVHLQGRCCPVCPESFLSDIDVCEEELMLDNKCDNKIGSAGECSACNYDNHLYLEGDFMLLIDRCTLCKCKGTTWNCTKKHCNKTVNGIESTFSVKNKISNDEHERNPSSDISGKPEKKEYFGSDNDDFIVEDPNRMIGRAAIVSRKENATTSNKEKQLNLNVGESATPSSSSHTGYEVETSTDTNENVDKTYVKKSHLGSRKRPENNHGHGIQPLLIDYKNRGWSRSWYQDALRVSDSKNDTIVYRTKRLL